MMMPDSYEIKDNGTLVIIVNEVEYEFAEKEDFIYSDMKKIILKHHAIINLATNANIKVGPPVLLSSNDSGSFVFAREAIRSDGVKLTAVGEANAVTGNLWSEYLQQYPAETADNRAYERAVLGVVGVHGKIYGGSEIPFADCAQDEKPKNEIASDDKNDVSDQNAKVASEEKSSEQQIVASHEHPKWWNDIGTGLYTDSQLEPETFIVTQGQCKGKNWTVKYLYDFNYKSCWYFATRDLDNAPSEEFTKQVFACRRAIRKYGIKKEEAAA